MIERVAYRPLRTAPRMSVMISAIGVSYLIQNLALYITGGLNKNYPSIPWISDRVTVFGMETSRVTIITPFLTIILVVLLVQLINHTKTLFSVGKRLFSRNMPGQKLPAEAERTWWRSFRFPGRSPQPRALREVPWRCWRIWERRFFPSDVRRKTA